MGHAKVHPHAYVVDIPQCIQSLFCMDIIYLIDKMSYLMVLISHIIIEAGTRIYV
jgi:hypothetical protein